MNNPLIADISHYISGVYSLEERTHTETIDYDCSDFVQSTPITLLLCFYDSTVKIQSRET